MEITMTNFNVNFTNAWWLLLLIPAVALTLISYFRLNKRYRCTRNRIVSISLHLVIMLLAIALLAGLSFEYYKPNTETEVILLVDSSFTTEDTESDSDDYIRSIIDNCDSMLTANNKRNPTLYFRNNPRWQYPVLVYGELKTDFEK